MTDRPADDTTQSSPDPLREGTDDHRDADFPALDFPGAEALQGAQARRLTERTGVSAQDRGGALGTHGYELYTLSDGVTVCLVDYECVEQSELFPSVCNQWQAVWFGCA